MGNTNILLKGALSFKDYELITYIKQFKHSHITKS